MNIPGEDAEDAQFNIWVVQAKIGAALEPPTLTQEGKNPSIREVQLRFPTDASLTRNGSDS